MTRKPVVSEKLPTIIIDEVEHDRLTSLAERAVSSAPDAASILRAELRRATVVAAEKVPLSVIRMGSRVAFTFDGGHPRDVILVTQQGRTSQRVGFRFLRPSGPPSSALRKASRSRGKRMVTVFTN